MALYSLTVLCALFQAAAAVSRQPPPHALALWPVHLACIAISARFLLSPSTFRAQAPPPGCTGITTEANSPLGEYAAENIQVGKMAEVTRIAFTFPKITPNTLWQPLTEQRVKFTQELTGCMFDQSLDPSPCVAFKGTKVQTFTDGAFQGAGIEGSVFIPKPPSPAGKFDINDLLYIKWCPNQNYFQVTVAGAGPYTLSKTLPQYVPYNSWQYFYCRFPYWPFQGWCRRAV